MPLDPQSVPRLWRVARLDFDRVRRRHVLLYPEGAVFINESSRAILELCDGQRTVAEITRVLGERFGVDVTADVDGFLALMAGRDLVTIRNPAPAGSA